MKRWKALPLLRGLVWLILCTLLLLLADRICYQIALPVDVVVQDGVTSVLVGETHINLGRIGTPIALQFEASDPLIHEYQIDGTDSTNNFTLDVNYLRQIATTPYYRFQSWMRDLDGTSRWRDLHIQSANQTIFVANSPANGATFAFPQTHDLRIDMDLQRPETPRSFRLQVRTATGKIEVVRVTLDRNDRYIDVSQLDSGQVERQLAYVFFPTDPWPFLAMVLSFVVRTFLWAIVTLCVVLIGEMILAVVHVWFSLPAVRVFNPWWRFYQWGKARINSLLATLKRVLVLKRSRYGFVCKGWEAFTTALHPLVLPGLLVSFVFVCWIARVEYNGEPHIFDAAAYLFAAKMYAQGHLSLPLPPAAELFPGPFMVQFAGRWFVQYPPGTAVTLVPGVWLGVPWLIEPLCGTAALFGIGLIAARLYNRRVASLAVLLGVLSPFYSYLAASYLSHAIALFYLVWGFWACLRFMQGSARWNLLLGTFCFGMAALTRDLVGFLWIVLGVAALLVICRVQVRMKNWRKWLLPVICSLMVGAVFLALSLLLNLYLTHNALLSARSLFFAGDRWGFGKGIGFYGQHTLAAGFVNLDELLTILAIDLYGWPFYLTLTFIVLPFVTLRATLKDVMLFVCAVILMVAYVGYFYHGIYLGPRYFFEVLPFFLILSARGMVVLSETGTQIGQFVYRAWLMRRSTHAGTAALSRPGYRESVFTWLVVLGLVACTLIYYLPRQVVIYQNYSGLPASEKLDLQAIYQPHLHDAIVVTSDIVLYQCDLFPLNDPSLQNTVIYALASTPQQYAELDKAFPRRAIYQLQILPDGTVQYLKIEGL